MDYELTVTEEDGFLRFQVTGTNSPETVRQYMKEVYSRCEAINSSLALVIENLTGPGLSVVDIYEIILQASSRPRGVIRVMAFADINREHSYDSMKFAETDAINRLCSVRLFTSAAIAEQWIHEKASEAASDSNR